MSGGKMDSLRSDLLLLAYIVEDLVHGTRLRKQAGIDLNVLIMKLENDIEIEQKSKKDQDFADSCYPEKAYI
jgi:hypothetical protein